MPPRLGSAPARGAAAPPPPGLPRTSGALAAGLGVGLTGSERVGVVEAPLLFDPQHVRRVYYVLFPGRGARLPLRPPDGRLRAPRSSGTIGTMRIGDVEVRGLARLAPMAGATNAPFRLVARECGSAMTTTEEMDAASVLFQTPHALSAAAYYPAERPLAMQLLGKDPEALAAAAARCEALGADVVDLNMGCPVPKITGKGKGAALMRDVPAAARILRTMRRAIRVPLTVKIRGGWDETHLNAVEIARMAQEEGVDAITVHPRTRAQQFTGKAPWTIIAEVVDAVRLPVTGNGDVHSMDDARRMVAATGCQSVMIGRGALGRPWVFDEGYDALSPPDQRPTARG